MEECCYRWSWFEVRSKICSTERQAKLRGTNKVKLRTSSKIISLVYSTIYWYIMRVWIARFLVLCLGLCLSREGMRRAFSYGYNHIAALSPWEQYIICPFRHASIRQLLCLMTVDAMKLAQAGFRDFLVDTGVSRLKGTRYDNKVVYFVCKICNSAGHK